MANRLGKQWKQWPTLFWGALKSGYGFSSGHVWMGELDCEESWALKNWCFWTVVLEKTLWESLGDLDLESPKEIQPVHPKGDQSWVFIGGTDVEAGTPILSPPDAKGWLIGKKTLMLGKIEGRRRRGRRRMRWLDGITDWMDMSLVSGSWWWTGRPGVLQSMGSQRVGQDWETEVNWTELKTLKVLISLSLRHFHIWLFSEVGTLAYS